MNAFLPMNEAVLTGGLGLFAQVATIISGLVSAVFMMRICFLVVRISGAAEYGELLKDTATFLGMLSIYPTILKFVVYGIGDLAGKISYITPAEAQGSIQTFMNKMFMDYPLFNVFGKIGGIIFLSLAQSIYTALICLFVAAGPIFIFLATMLGVHSGIKSYFGILISLSLWPVMWNLLGKLAVSVGTQFENSPVSALCFWVVVQILQLLSPIFSFSLFKNMSTDVGISKVVGMGSMLL